MKRPQTNFHADTMRKSQIISQKKSKFSIRSKFIAGSDFHAAQFSFLFIDILLKLQQQMLICFCKFSCYSVILMCLLQFLTSWCCFAH